MRVDYTEEMQSYIEALEEERRKILVFQRELPLCLELVTQAIGACKQQLSATGVATECKNNNGNGQSECSEQTSTEGTPVLEEFIPVKRPSKSEEDEDEQHSHKPMKIDDESDGNKEKSSSADSKKKSDWLRSAQLWNQTPDPPPKEEHHQPPRKVPVIEVTRNGGAFQPFHRDQKGSAKSHQSSEKPHSPAPTAATSSTTETATGGKRVEKEGQSQTQTPTQRKQRRCWSPELHRRFLQALQQLGGSHAATPKQIREQMKVDGLTNDEVKSHLQKFRLHTRRPSPAIHSSSSSQPPQFVVVGGIWVPPPEYTAVAAPEAAKATSANGIYTPITASPPPAAKATDVNSKQNPKSEGRGSHSSHSNSSPSSTSSSSHTTTASPLY
ncbi:transcription factor HHO3-like [Punica granatum]|uniref:HTH myb-type domain-containing protein n=2 Tax=Punica granatum TaxID=22663 RepID=A0A218WSE8_PUNGR|nr:transcription factor HHO3-like [Punica granatum]OWM75797.1 hypothetical protein CDL15_Pgr009441 [Punica granatum]PKI60499.1 hypothetical protein CRG98_019153 [Punica granatum]